MEPYYYENEEYIEFQEDYTKAEAEKMFADFKRTKKGKKCKDDLETYMQAEHSCYATDDDGNFGNNNNPNGLYDWFVVGGRVANCLFPKMSKADMKKLQNEELNNKEKFKRHLAEYMRLRSLSPKEYLRERERTLGDNDLKAEHFKFDIEKGNIGHTSILARELDEKTTAQLWHYKIKSMSEIFENVICEEDGLMDGKEDFNHLLKYWREKNGMLTIIDCHT